MNNTYPHYNLKSKQLPHVYWKDKNKQHVFFDELAKTLNIQKPEDWYSVSVKTVLEKGGSFVNTLYNGSVIRGKWKSENYMIYLYLSLE